jgi:anti-anti-sigma factor
VQIGTWSMADRESFARAQSLLVAMWGHTATRAAETIVAAAATLGQAPPAIAAEFLRCATDADGRGSGTLVAMLHRLAATDDSVAAGESASTDPYAAGREDEQPFDAVALVSGALRVVTVHGELDAATRHLLSAAVAEACCPGADRDDRAASNGLLLNLAGLSFLDACGLSELIATRERAAAHGLVLHVAAPAARGPRRLLRLAVDLHWLDGAFAPPPAGAE